MKIRLYKKVGLSLIMLAMCISILIGYYVYRASTTDANSVLNEHYFTVEQTCWFKVPAGQNIRCGELRTPISTGKFSLPFVVIMDDSYGSQPDPVVYLQGGPGGSARLHDEGILEWIYWLENMNLGRDLILLEPRGVGRSQPALVCAEYDRFSEGVLRQNVTMQDELAQGSEVLKKCYAQLSQAPVRFDMNHYGSKLHAQDIQALMKQLSYSQWNYLGVSYGTRVAIHAATGSNQVRSMILDSVYPEARGGVQTFPNVLNDAFQQFFRWCAINAPCDSSTISIQQRLVEALKLLQQKPVTLTISGSSDAFPIDVVVNDHRFISAIFSALYNKHQWEKISPAINAVLSGQSKELQQLVTPFVNTQFSADFNGLAFMAVDCRDHPVLPHEDYVRGVKEIMPWLAGYVGELWAYQPCHFLRADDGSDKQLQALPQIPALILAGDLDPITPLAWAKELHDQWPASQLKIVENTGHSVIGSDNCIYQLLRKFLDKPEAELEGCAENLVQN